MRSKMKIPFFLKKKLFFRKKTLYTKTRHMKIYLSMVGLIYQIHNGKQHITLKIHENMLNHRLGEFSFTRSYSGHKKKKKKK